MQAKNMSNLTQEVSTCKEGLSIGTKVAETAIWLGMIGNMLER